MPSDTIILRGKLPPVKPEDAAGISIYLVRGAEILAETEIPAEGEVRLNLNREALSRKSVFGLEAVVGPSGMGDQLNQVPQLHRIPLDIGELGKVEREFRLSLEKLQINPDI